MATLSQIRAWDIDHLIEAAEHWGSTAGRWDNVYGQVWQQSLGMDWQGHTRDALVERKVTADATENLLVSRAAFLVKEPSQRT